MGTLSPQTPCPISSSGMRRCWGDPNSTHGSRLPAARTGLQGRLCLWTTGQSQVFGGKEVGVPSVPRTGHSRSTCSWGHSTEAGAQDCPLLPTHHQTRGSAKPGLTLLTKGADLSLLPRGITLTDHLKSPR